MEPHQGMLCTKTPWAPLSVNSIERNIDIDSQKQEHMFLVEQLSTHIFHKYQGEPDLMSVNAISSTSLNVHNKGEVAATNTASQPGMAAQLRTALTQHSHVPSVNAICTKKGSLYDKCLQQVKRYENLNGSSDQNGPQVNTISSGVTKGQNIKTNVYYFPSAGCSMQPAAIERDMPQTVNMINSACDSDNSGWGQNYPGSNNSGVPTGVIQNRKAVNSKENVDRETSPVTQYIGEHLSQGKKDSP